MCLLLFQATVQLSSALRINLAELSVHEYVLLFKMMCTTQAVEEKTLHRLQFINNNKNIYSDITRPI